jgi:hypothetical protein
LETVDLAGIGGEDIRAVQEDADVLPEACRAHSQLTMHRRRSRALGGEPGGCEAECGVIADG